MGSSRSDLGGFTTLKKANVSYVIKLSLLALILWCTTTSSGYQLAMLMLCPDMNAQLSASSCLYEDFLSAFYMPFMTLLDQ